MQSGIDLQTLQDHVLTGLECCKQFVYECDRCPYFNEMDERETICVEKLHRDAIVLIRALTRRQAEEKEQERP